MSAVRRGLRTLHTRAEEALEAVAARPRHLLLFALAAGLLLGPISEVAVLGVAGAGLVIAGRPGAGLLAIVAVLGGAALGEARIAALEEGALPGLAGRTLSAEAILVEPPRERPTGARAARVRFLAGPAQGEVAAARVAPEVPWPASPSVGEILTLSGRVEALGEYESYQRRRGALAAFVVARASATGRRRGGLAGDLDAVRARAERALTAGLAPPEAGLLRGMVLGQDEAIEEPVREEFRRSGLAHLLAASGQNVMLLAILAIAAATALGAGLRARLVIALLAVVLYVPLAGAGPSIQRAGVMGAAGLVAALAGRPASRWYALGLACAVTLALEPRAAGEPGWQLSFAAVVALLALAPALRGWLERRGCPRALADALAITVAATLGTAPLMALHFEAVSPASLPANLLAAPAVAPVMWLGMLAATAGQVSTALAQPLTAVAAYPVAYVEWVAHVTSALPSASVPVRLPGPAAVAVAYAALAATGVALAAGGRAWRRRAGPRLRRGAAVAALAAIAAGGLVAVRAAGPPARAPGELVVSFLDVGQGDATLLQHDETAILFDTGPPGGPILQRLREAGVGGLDALVLTHGQADHEGMAPAVLRAHPARLVLNGGAGEGTPVQRRLPLLTGRSARTVVPSAGDVARIGALELRVLWPPAPHRPGEPAPEGDPNDRAVVTHVRLGEFDLLLPADAESSVTAALALPDVEALKVAHHGSADDGLAAQLGQLTPHVAVIEVGRGNTYGHPTASTLAALRSVPRVLRTDRDGTVRLRVAGGRMEVER